MPEADQTLHVYSELAAVVFVAPYLAWLAFRVPQPHRSLVLGIAVATLAIDGWLLGQWMAQ